jgi:hypothetical protein
MESMTPQPGTKLALDPRDERLVDGASRWMGMLGRFQVLFGGLVLLLEVGAALGYWLVDRLDEAAAASSETTPPLVALGTISTETAAMIAIGILIFGGLMVRGGTLLIDAAEDFERHLHQKDDADRLLHDGLVRLGTYFVLESLLVGAVLAGLMLLGARP